MHNAAMTTPPPGLTGTDPMPHGYRRWNGTIWTDAQVDLYNRELFRIVTRHRCGMNVDHLVNGLYNMADAFDRAGRLGG